MDLTTNYMGFHLRFPVIVGASPLSDRLDRVRRLEDAGAGAVVLRSLFEEQLTSESIATHAALYDSAHSYAEAGTYLPEPDDFVLGPDEYLNHLSNVRKAVDIPVFASLNGTTLGGWTRYAALMEQAGADALELNLYHVITDPDISGQEIENEAANIVRSIVSGLRIPVAAKLSPSYTSLANFARRLNQCGASGLVLYNRYYEPDIDTETLDSAPHLSLSTSSELPSRLRWIGILHDRVEASLAVTGGVHTAIDVIKSMMCGAHAVQMVSALLLNGPEYLVKLRSDIDIWLQEHEYQSLRQLCGSMSLARCPRPAVYGRGNYMHLLQTWPEEALE